MVRPKVKNRRSSDISIRVLPKTKKELKKKLVQEGYSSISEFFRECIRKFLTK